MCITQAYLKECFNYNPATGALTWRHRPLSHFKRKASSNTFNKNYAGHSAGSLFSTKGLSYKLIGLSMIGIKSKKYSAHRLIWLYVYGEWPNEIDHINGDGLDNRILNIRSVTHKENMQNRKQASNNTSGCNGVYWDNNINKWRASITINGKLKHIGVYIDFDKAASSRKSMEAENNYHTNHSRVIDSMHPKPNQ